MKKVMWGKLLFFVLVSEAAGIIGSLFTFSAIPTWYVFLNKPSFSPPNYIFGPVWTILYFLMGISVYLVWKKGIKKQEVRNASALFFIHLIFNSLWSIIFFGMKNIALAFFEIIILWFLIVAVMIRFYRIDVRAGLLLIPYLLWVSFASYLTYSVWVLNR